MARKRSGSRKAEKECALPHRNQGLGQRIVSANVWCAARICAYLRGWAVGQNWIVRAGSLAACAIAFLPIFALEAVAAQGAGAPVKAVKPPAAVVSAGAAKTAEQDPQVTSSVERGEVDPGCLRARKRLWVEGEGWVVRRVTTCF